MRDAYDGIAAAWDAGPGPAYERMAAVLVARLPFPLAGAWVLDLGAGTGAVSRCLAHHGARPLALDPALAMLREGTRRRRFDAVAGEGEWLPIRDGAFDAAVAAFSLSHVADPVVTLREVRRVLRSGSAFAAMTFAAAPEHPVKEVVNQAGAAFGFQPPAWYAELKGRELALADPAALRAVATAAGHVDVAVEELRVDTGVDTADSLIGWRLGMANLAPFVAGLAPQQRDALVAAARDALGPAPQPWRPLVLILSSRAPA